MEILVTGAAGFIGSNFIKLLLERTDHKIHALDCLNYASDFRNISNFLKNSNRINFLHANIDDDQVLKSINYDVVINFAAETHVTRSINDSRNFIINDMLATDTLLKSSIYEKKLKLFIHISTSEVYGTCDGNKKMDEEHKLNPLSPYAAAKCGGDRLVYSYGHTYGLPFVILRPFNNYGPKQHLEKVIPRFITSIINKKNLDVHGNGDSSRDFIHVDDTCEAILKVLLSKKNIEGNEFNIGSGMDISVKDIAIKLCELKKYSKNKINYIFDRPGQVAKHICNYTKFSSTFDWKPKIDFDSGLKLTFKWYEENKDWWREKVQTQKVRIVMPNGEVFFH